MTPEYAKSHLDVNLGLKSVKFMLENPQYITNSCPVHRGHSQMHNASISTCEMCSRLNPKRKLFSWHRSMGVIISVICPCKYYSEKEAMNKLIQYKHILLKAKELS